jgi:pimeloyl-ACP methyl ester carboxylesterase
MALAGVAAAAAAAAGVGSAVTAGAYRRDMRRAYERVRARGTVVPSPYGDIEYVEGGSGAPVLVVHGSGGGFDQGELLAQAVLGDGFRWVAPSRFGYLRSTLRASATFDEQAHAYACLLDHLGIGRAAVVALSHGGPSALLFAALHPERVSSLTLISCGVASSGGADQAAANRQGDLLARIFRHDLVYWATHRMFGRRLIALLGSGSEVTEGLAPPQRDLIDRVIGHMDPVSPRAAGVAFDNAAALPNERIAAVRAPTLVLHAEDDALQLHRNAEFAATTIRGARLVSFPRGGHLLLGVEQPAIRAAVREHVLRCAPQRIAAAGRLTAARSCAGPSAEALGA